MKDNPDIFGEIVLKVKRALGMLPLEETKKEEKTAAVEEKKKSVVKK